MKRIAETLPAIDEKIAAAKTGAQALKTELIAAGVRNCD
jgi:hypothetical protein